MSSIKPTLLVCLLFLTPKLFAHDMWTGMKTVASVQVTNNGGFILNLDSEISDVCTYAGKSALLISPNENSVTEAGAKSLLSTALIAFSTGSKVNIMYSDDTIFCWGHSLSILK